MSVPIAGYLTSLSDAAVPVVPAELALLMQKIGRGCTAALPTVDSHVTLRLNLQSEIGDEDGTDDLVRLTMTYGDIQIAGGSRLLQALTGLDPRPAFVDEADHASWFHAALVGRLAGTPFSGVATIRASQSVDKANLVAVRITLSSPVHSFSVCARATAATWAGLLEQSEWQRELRPVSELDQLRCSTAVMIARHTLPAAALDDLVPGDIFLPDTTWFSVHGEGIFRLGRLSARVRYTGPCALEIIEVKTPMDMNAAQQFATEMDKQEKTVGAGSPGDEMIDPLQGIPLTLDFCLGHVHMSLGKVRTLETGAVLLLEGGSPAAITIASGGHRLGSGEIVNVDGQLGVRVVAWGGVGE